MSRPRLAAAPAPESRPDEGLCSWRINGRYCRVSEDTVRFLPGWRCPLHTPNALAGRPEPPPGPGIPAYREAP